MQVIAKICLKILKVTLLTLVLCYQNMNRFFITWPLPPTYTLTHNLKYPWKYLNPKLHLAETSICLRGAKNLQIEFSISCVNQDVTPMSGFSITISLLLHCFLKCWIADVPEVKWIWCVITSDECEVLVRTIELHPAKRAGQLLAQGSNIYACLLAPTVPPQFYVGPKENKISLQILTSININEIKYAHEYVIENNMH